MDSYYDDGGCCIVHPDSADLILTGGRGPSTQTNWSFVVSYSRDGGTKWTRCDPTPASAGFCHALAVARFQANIIYAGGEVAGAGAVYRSTDFGVTWNPTNAAPADTVFSLVVVPSHPDWVLAATPSGVIMTTDAGATWSCVLDQRGVRAVMVDPLDQGTIFSGGDNGVSVSYDAGQTWTDLSAGLGNSKVTCLGGGGVLLAGTVGASCYADSLPPGISSAKMPSAITGLGARPNPFTACCRVPGHEQDEFVVFDHSGRRVSVARGDRIGAGLAAGVYFLRGLESNAAPVRIVKTR
jgi:photosystem II stability/assembly factor-like uncharacterized protein